MRKIYCDRCPKKIQHLPKTRSVKLDEIESYEFEKAIIYDELWRKIIGYFSLQFDLCDTCHEEIWEDVKKIKEEFEKGKTKQTYEEVKDA